MSTGSVRAEGARIVYDYEGSGPLLLMIPGGGGEGHRYAVVSGLLTNEYTVLRYDRRGFACSSVDPAQDWDISQQARDAAAVIHAFGERAYVFGNGSGANVGMELTASNPSAVTALIAHEPPVMSLLPDADVWLAFVEDVHATFQADGTGPAMRKFTASLTGLGQLFASPPACGEGASMRDFEVFIGKEYYPASTYLPDLDRLTASGRPIVAAAGHDSADGYCARTARVFAGRLGCEYAEFPGHHLAFLTEPAAFAAALRGIPSDAEVLR